MESRVDNIIAHNNDTEGNSELIDIREGVDGTIYTTAGRAVREQINDSKTPIEHYPFAETPSNPYTYALLNLKIIASTANELYIYRIIRNKAVPTNTVHAIVLKDENGNSINILNVLSSGYTEVTPDTIVYFNVSGVEGYYNIDWSKIPDETDATNNNNNLKGAKVNSLIMPNRLITDTTLTKIGLPADGKSVGDAIGAVQDEIDDINETIDVIQSIYPFAETPSNTATYALINLKILSTIYDDIYIAGVVRNNGANGVYAIVLKAADGTQINILNTVASQYTEVAPEMAVHFSVNGVEGYYNIDWSKIESGTAAYNSNNNWKGAKINSLCMPNRLVTDTTLAKAGLSADSKTVGDSLSAMSDSIGDVKSLFTHYPFAEIPSNQYTYALINLKIISSTSNEIYIFRVARQAAVSGNTVHSITLINGSGEQIHVLNGLSSQYTEVSPDTPVYFNKSGVEGYYNIDWDAIPAGTNAYNTNNNWKGAKINSLCMPNRLVTDTTLSKVGLPADSKTVGDSLSTLSKEVSSDRFILPSVVYGVVGKPFSVYYYNIFKIDSLEGYHVVVSPSSAEVENMGDRVRFACTAAASYTVNFSIRKNDNISLASKTITVTILPDTVRSIKAIFIGDSFINDGRMVAELKSELGNYMTLYGTRTKTADNSSGESITVYHEGRSGWSLNDYLTKSEKGGVQNAFWDGNSFNFGYYISQHNDFSDATDVFILSGPNDYAATTDVYGQRYAQIIASIRTYSQSIKIHCLMPLTCVCSGYAWGVRNHNSAETFRYFMMDYGNEILDLVSNYSDVFAVPMYVYFDRNYNFPTTQVVVNDRTPTLVTVFNDNVHPNGYGYYSMSDMIYADIIATT